MFNESSNWDKIKQKKKEFYDKMANNFDFRMKQVDMKLMVMNGGSKRPRYVRYKTTVHDTMLNVEYEIGPLGQLREYKARDKKQY